MKKLVLILASLLLFTSCQKFQSEFSEIRNQCELATVAGTVVQVLDPDGQFIASRPDNIRVFWINSERKTSSLSLNARGCVQLPEDNGTLEVSVSLPAGAVRRDFVKTEALRFETLRLIPSPSLFVQKRCPDENLYANDSLFFPYGFSQAGDLSNVEMILWARPRPEGQAIPLWHKPFGEKEVPVPEKLSVLPLAEGSYSIQIAWQELSTGREAAQSSLCNVQIKRSLPVISGLTLTSSPQPRSIAQNTILPWTSRNSEDSLWLCRRRLQEPLSLLPGEGCELPNQYKPVQLIVADQEGLWQYCLMAEDRAGNRSPPACEQLLISSSAPKLKVEWADAELKSSLPILKRPYAKVQATIHIEHPVLQQQELQKSLQCKVMLEMGPDIQSKGNSVLCASGTCDGQDMSEFRSCPTQLTLELTNLWTRGLQRKSRLTLHVRSDDGAGQSSEAKAELWIHDGAWYAEPMSSGAFGIPSDEVPRKAILDPGGQPWVKTETQDHGPRIYRWDGSSWILSLDLSRDSTLRNLELIRGTGRHRLFAVATPLGSESQFYELQQDETWKHLPAPRADFAETCIRVTAIVPNGLACLTKESILLWQEQKWTAIDRPKEEDTALCTDLDSMMIVEHDRIWMPCKGIMYLFAGGLWQKCPSPDIDVIESIRLDERGRVWAQTVFPFYAHNGLGYFTSDGTWHPTGPAQGMPASLLGTKFLLLSREGRIYYGPYLWNESILRWEIFRNAGVSAFDASAETLPGVHDEAWIAIQSQSTLVELNRERPLVWHLPSERMKYEGSDLAFRDKSSQLWLMLSDVERGAPELYRLRDSRFLVWDERLFGFSIQGDWFLNQMKMDAQGRFWLLRSGRLYLYEQGAWRFQANFAAPLPGFLLPTPSGRLFLGAPGAIYEWTANGPVLYKTSDSSQLYLSQLAEDADGTIWLRPQDSVGSEVYRLHDHKLRKLVVDAHDPEDSFLDAHIMTVAGRLLMIRGAKVWGYDKIDDRFVLLDPSAYSLQPDAPSTIHPLNLEQTLVQVFKPDEGSQSLTVFSRKDATARTLPTLPEQRILEYAALDQDGSIWAQDSSGQYMYRWTEASSWTLVLGPEEMKRRLQQDSLNTRDMVRAPEGGIFIQQHRSPLLRFLPSQAIR